MVHAHGMWFWMAMLMSIWLIWMFLGTPAEEDAHARPPEPTELPPGDRPEAVEAVMDVRVAQAVRRDERLPRDAQGDARRGAHAAGGFDPRSIGDGPAGRGVRGGDRPSAPCGGGGDALPPELPLAERVAVRAHDPDDDLGGCGAPGREPPGRTRPVRGGPALRAGAHGDPRAPRDGALLRCPPPRHPRHAAVLHPGPVRAGHLRRVHPDEVADREPACAVRRGGRRPARRAGGRNPGAPDRARAVDGGSGRRSGRGDGSHGRRVRRLVDRAGSRREAHAGRRAAGGARPEAESAGVRRLAGPVRHGAQPAAGGPARRRPHRTLPVRRPRRSDDQHASRCGRCSCWRCSSGRGCSCG